MHLKLSLRVQQTALFVVVVLVAMLFFSMWLVRDLERSIRDVSRVHQIENATVIADAVGAYFPTDSRPLSRDERDAVDDQVQRFGDIFSNDIRVYLPSGESVSLYHGLDLPLDLVERARRHGLADRNPFAEAALGDGVVVASSAVWDKRARKVAVVVVSSSASQELRLLSTARADLRIGFWLALGLSALLGYAFSDFISRQVHRLLKAAQAIAEGDFGTRLPRRMLPDEIGDLVDSYNRMAEQLGTAFSQLQSQERAQREFVANASHELRTPIAALSGFLELLEGGAQDKPEVRAKFLRTMSREVARLERLTNDLFTLARLDSGRTEMDMGRHTVAELVHGAISVMQPLAEEAALTLAVDIPPQDLAVVCDRDRIVQVLIGFIDNALKHVGPDRAVTLWARLDGSSVTLGVRDAGVGVPSDQLPHLFERFFRMPGDRAAGTGLGLAIAKEIVEAHGAQIQVHSRVGEGSDFYFSLPLACAAALGA